jgi:hypothetical protein
MSDFKQLPKEENLKEVIKTAFNSDLEISGSWGYSEEEATIIHEIPDNFTITQLEHMLTSMRAHLEMNLTQEDDNRYGAINANERDRVELQTTDGKIHKVTYEISAIKEDTYNTLIKEYKEGYGKEDFDLQEHFKKREESTLLRNVSHYFYVKSKI